jgi:hypothetical protein
MRVRTLLGLTTAAIVIAAVAVVVWQASGRSQQHPALAVERDLFGAPIIAREDAAPAAQATPGQAESGLASAGLPDAETTGPQPDWQPSGEPAKPFVMPEIKAYA